MNQLAKEKSPYLLEHAQNPVDWYPWNDEAFAKASRQNKPIILSIGYSTCHWCHVMQRESFENSEIAALMNEHFVSIKVDREERPDIDQVYMASVTAMTGHGGWPLTVFLTPDKKPFYGGTYFPPYAKWGSPGFRDLLQSIADAWQTKQDDVLSSSRELVDLLRRRFSATQPSDETMMSEELLELMYGRLRSQFDVTYGGFGQAPKFPMGHTLSLLLRYWQRTGEESALEMAVETLRSMAHGGIFDQLGGGFHRYSTDQAWHVPHFEKMLYDQAILVRAYGEAFQATGDMFFADIARRVLDYVLKELTDPSGGFYCAQDADSLDPEGHKREGAFYVWGTDEIEQVLADEKAAAVVSYYFGLRKEGNALEDPHGEFTGKNILSVSYSIEDTAGHFQLEADRVLAIIKNAKSQLLERRGHRPSPHLDDKVMTDWNGLMISAFAFASQVLEDDHYLAAARKAADFILKTLVDPQGRLLHRYRDGQAGILATLEDYSFFIAGLLDVYEATGEVRYMTNAKILTDQMLKLFEDGTNGGFFMTGSDAPELFVRVKETYDGALPSGNSAALLLLLRMYHLTTNEIYRESVQRAFGCFSKQVSLHPEAYGVFLSAFDFFLGPVDEIILSGEENNSDYQKMRRMVYNGFRPNKVVAVVPREHALKEEAAQMVPILKEKFSAGNAPQFYLCRDRVCSLPAGRSDDWQGVLNQFQPSRRA